VKQHLSVKRISYVTQYQTVQYSISPVIKASKLASITRLNLGLPFGSRFYSESRYYLLIHSLRIVQVKRYANTSFPIVIGLRELPSGTRTLANNAMHRQFLDPHICADVGLE